MSADPGSIRAGDDPALPNLVALDASADPHIITTRVRTGTDIELRIHTTLTPFDVAAEPWIPAAAGFDVTVIVHTVDAQTGRPRYLPSTEPAEWARTISSAVDSSHGYFLGAVDPGTGVHRRGQLAYRLYVDTDRRAIPVPRAGGHLPALPAISHRRQSRDHHSHDGLTRQAGRLPDHGLRALLP